MTTIKFGKREYLRETLAARKEEAVKRDILDYLMRAGIPHSPTQAEESRTARGNLVFRVAPGWPDITACGPEGKLVGIECKRPIGDEGLSYNQAVTLHALWRAGGLILVARDVADVEELFRVKKSPQATLDEVAARLAKGITPADVRRQLARRTRRAAERGAA